MAGDFFGLSYDQVAIGCEGNKIVYQGQNQSGWYEFRESVGTGVTQRIKKLRIENDRLLIVFGKDWAVVGLVAILFGIICAGFFLLQSFLFF